MILKLRANLDYEEYMGLESDGIPGILGAGVFILRRCVFCIGRIIGLLLSAVRACEILCCDFPRESTCMIKVMRVTASD